MIPIVNKTSNTCPALNLKGSLSVMKQSIEFPPFILKSSALKFSPLISKSICVFSLPKFHKAF